MSGQFKRFSIRTLAWLRGRRTASSTRWFTATTELVGGYLLIATTAFAFGAGPFAWILRDGQRAGTAESTTGYEAIWKMFWCFEWGPILLILMLATTFVQRLNRR